MNDGHMNLRLPSEVIEKIDAEAKLSQVNRSAIVRDILVAHYEVTEE